MQGPVLSACYFTSSYRWYTKIYRPRARTFIIQVIHQNLHTTGPDNYRVSLARQPMATSRLRLIETFWEQGQDESPQAIQLSSCVSNDIVCPDARRRPKARVSPKFKLIAQLCRHYIQKKDSTGVKLWSIKQIWTEPLLGALNVRVLALPMLD